MNKITCLIIDDEKEAREGLELLLKTDASVKILGQCQDGLEAIEKINQLKPDLIFLDIQMPGINGFEVLSSIERPLPKVVFVTAFDQYALKAFEVHAMDYILKPFDDDRFYSCLSNAKKNLGKKEDGFEDFVHQQARATGLSVISSGREGTLVIKSDGKIIQVKLEELTWIEGYDYYVKVHLSSGFHLVRETLKNLQTRLDDRFVRVHRSAIVNIDHVLSMDMGKSDASLILKGGETVKVSRANKKTVMKKLTERQVN